ncbi:membrane protein [Gordoniibacillus kamchatkensis]|uniref:Membrane protein n=1 Tax=Gordoniibacillus kamchatkensis TaxID=1590651 RepID=A0ABR5AFU5_9BACL|nr:DUF5317 domain-containing protein [Paenibacillus sp. VKM B-2647]KIL39928.1 membrane protein [Paenibacillus sp. VKM B-2647]
MAFDGVIIGILVGLLRRGSLKGFLNVKLRYGWVFPILLAIQFLVYIFETRYAWVAAISNFTFMAVYIVGFVFLWMNRKEKGFLVLMAGVFLNFLVMLINGGRMPVSLEAASTIGKDYAQALQEGTLYGKHMVLTAETKLAFLGDIIPLNKPYYKQQVISIGDVVCGIGIFLYIQNLMVLDRPKKQKLPIIEKVL